MKGSEIQNLDFNSSFYGFKKTDVKACLMEISEYVLRLESKLYKLEVERDKLKDKLKKIEIGQVNFKDIIVGAQEFKKKIEIEAKKQAEEIILKAKKQYQEILSATKNEQLKLNFIKKEVENVAKSILEKLNDFKYTVEMKEKNISINEKPVYDFKEIETKTLDEKNYNSEELIKIDSNDNQENIRLNDKTLEFNAANSKNVDEKDYIKSKFREIELR